VALGRRETQPVHRVAPGRMSPEFPGAPGSVSYVYNIAIGDREYIRDIANIFAICDIRDYRE